MRFTPQAIILNTVAWLHRLVGMADGLSLAERAEAFKTLALDACPTEFATFTQSDWEDEALLNRKKPIPCANKNKCTQAEASLAVDRTYVGGPDAGFLGKLEWGGNMPFTKGIERCKKTVGCWDTFASAVRHAAVQLCKPNYPASVNDKTKLTEKIRNRLVDYQYFK